MSSSFQFLITWAQLEPKIKSLSHFTECHTFLDVQRVQNIVIQNILVKILLKHSLHQRTVIRMCVPTETGSSMMLRNQRLELLDMKRKARSKNPFHLPRYDVPGSWLTKLAVPRGVRWEIQRGLQTCHWVHSFSLLGFWKCSVRQQGTKHSEQRALRKVKRKLMSLNPLLYYMEGI